MIYDLSPTVSARIGVWPGDTPMHREVLADLDEGANLTLSTLRATVHLGTHTDAPSHTEPGTASIEAVPLDRYIGACQVVRVDIGRGERVRPEHLGEVLAERVLFATGTFPDPDHFSTDFAALSPELIDHLDEHGVVLAGIDTPSMDPFDSKDLPTHAALVRCEMASLEGVVLDGVPEGVYELVALPLKLAGFDASPVRAILRSFPA